VLHSAGFTCGNADSWLGSKMHLINVSPVAAILFGATVCGLPGLLRVQAGITALQLGHIHLLTAFVQDSITVSTSKC
jgi:hypothetical protein